MVSLAFGGGQPVSLERSQGRIVRRGHESGVHRAMREMGADIRPEGRYDNFAPLEIRGTQLKAIN